MDIRPTDLGSKRCAQLVLGRVAPYVSRSGAAQFPRSTVTPTSIGALGRYWLKGLDVDEETGAALLAATRGFTGGIVGGFAGGFGGGFGGPAIGMLAGGLAGRGNDSTVMLILGSVFAVAGVGGIFAGLTAPRAYLKRWASTPLSEGEIDALLHETSDALEKAYLGLVREAVRIQGAPEKAADEVRSAIKTVGEAIASLPPLPVMDGDLPDADALRADAAALHKKALAEADPVVSESLERRADALARQADALGHSQLGLRRAAALREELSAQIEALRLGLSAYYTAGHTDETALTQLATSARAVAGEATSLARATAELDAGPQLVQAGRR
ncbi:MAG: hypothetical protein QM758_01090 [Armatimonas sp.]